MSDDVNRRVELVSRLIDDLESCSYDPVNDHATKSLIRKLYRHISRVKNLGENEIIDPTSASHDEKPGDQPSPPDLSINRPATNEDIMAVERVVDGLADRLDQLGFEDYKIKLNEKYNKLNKKIESLETFTTGRFDHVSKMIQQQKGDFLAGQRTVDRFVSAIGGLLNQFIQGK